MNIVNISNIILKTLFQDPNNALKNLTQMCLLADLTLMLAWNPEEAGKIVETYKIFENKPPDLIMARAQQYPHQKVYYAYIINLFTNFTNIFFSFYKFHSWLQH